MDGTVGPSLPWLGAALRSVADETGSYTEPGDRTPGAANPAEAVRFAELHGTAAVDRALGTAVLAAEFPRVEHRRR